MNLNSRSIIGKCHSEVPIVTSLICLVDIVIKKVSSIRHIQKDTWGVGGNSKSIAFAAHELIAMKKHSLRIGPGIIYFDEMDA